MELVNHIVILWLISRGIAMLFSIVTAYVCFVGYITEYIIYYHNMVLIFNINVITQCIIQQFAFLSKDVKNLFLFI